MSDDRERSFENALARHLRPDAQHAGCSDPETLAAYHEQSLAPEYMASMQAHLSDCPRCQQILAQLQATDEIPLPAVNLAQPKTAAVQRGIRIIPGRKPTLWRWVAPVGALAAGLLVWVTAHESNLGRFAKAPSEGREANGNLKGSAFFHASVAPAVTRRYTKNRKSSGRYAPPLGYCATINLQNCT